MPATFLLLTKNPDLYGSWAEQVPAGGVVVGLEGSAYGRLRPEFIPVVVVVDTMVYNELPPGAKEAPVIVVGKEHTSAFEQLKTAKVADRFVTYDESKTQLADWLAVLQDLAESRAALKVQESRRTETSANPFPPMPNSSNLDTWDFVEGAVENLSSRERILSEFRRASRSLLRASHVVFFLRESGGFRADRGESYCPIDDPLISYLSEHPVVLDGENWPGPPDPVAEMTVRHRLAVWGARLLVPMHDNGDLFGIIVFGVRDDGQPYDQEKHERAVFLARLLRQFLAQSNRVNALNGQFQSNRIGERYLPSTLILGPDEQPPKSVPVVVRALMGEARKTHETQRVKPSLDQPFRASAGNIAETGGQWVVWEEASSEVVDQTSHERTSRLTLLRDLSLTLNHELGNSLMSLKSLRHAAQVSGAAEVILKASDVDIGRIEMLNKRLVKLSTLFEKRAERMDLRKILKGVGDKQGIPVEVGTDTVEISLVDDLMTFALESFIQAIIENRPDLGAEKLSLQLRAVGDAAECVALISIRGEQLELEGVLPLTDANYVPDHGKIAVFIAKEIVRLHGGEIHAGPGIDGTEILISVRRW